MVRGRNEEEAVGVELVRTLLAFIAGHVRACGGRHMEPRQWGESRFTWPLVGVAFLKYQPSVVARVVVVCDLESDPV